MVPNPVQARSAAKLRVLHVLVWIHPAGGGTQTYLRTVVQALTGSTVDVAAGALMPGRPTPHVPQPLHLGSEGRARAVNVMALLSWLWRAVPAVDVVHLHGVLNWPFLIGALVCRWRRVPYVVNTHGQLTHWFLARGRRLRRSYVRWLARPLLRRAHAVIATTEWELRQIVELARGARVEVVTPGLAGLEDATAAAPSASGELRIVFLGQFTAQKGLPVLLEAVALLREQGVAARLALVGNEGEAGFEARLRRRVAELRLEPAVDFCGYLQGPALQAMLRRCDVFALPSYMENFSFATAEALAAGVPAVVSNEVALAELIRRHDCGATVPADNAQALAEALAPYAKPDFRAARAARARACAVAEFSVATMRQRLEAVYRAAARQ